MNFLQILKKVDELAQTQGVISSVTPANGFQKGMVERVKQSNYEINMMRKDWLFNYTEVQAPINPSVVSFSDSTIRRWDSIVYDNVYLIPVPYAVYLREDWTTPKKPFKYTVAPDKSIIFNTPDDTYNIQCNGYLKPDELENDTDIPRIPDEYHYLIVYGALISLGSSLSLYNISSEYIMLYNTMMGTMMRDWVPSRNLRKRPLV